MDTIYIRDVQAIIDRVTLFPSFQVHHVLIWWGVNRERRGAEVRLLAEVAANEFIGCNSKLR